MNYNGLAIGSEEQRKAPLNEWCNFEVRQELGKRTLIIRAGDGKIIYKKVVIML